jgi:signal transduction histidine kinase
MFDWSSIQNIYKINLYRIIQEAILNVNKYANAQNCDINVQKFNDTSLIISIVDYGQGFDIKNKKNGIGLTNIKYRANSLNGEFYIESEIGIGTRIKVILHF